MGPFDLNMDIPYFAALRPPTFTTDGRIIFRFLGKAGTLSTSMENTLVRILDTNGFYMVQTGPLSYDMVSVADSRDWITWNF
jgi:hypothetical protein